MKKLLPPIVVICITLLVVYLLNSEDALIAQAKKELLKPVVSVVEVKPEQVSLDIKTNGVVTSRTQSRLVPEVTGKIISVNKKWVDGGFFKKGEAFFKIERHQYENQVAKAKAQLAEAKARYVQEQGMVHVAKKEWAQRSERSRQEAGDAARSLALREPQYESAKSQYEAALADLKAAEISLTKTSIKAHYDGILLKKAADIGQFVSANQAVGEFYAVDYAEVRVPLTESNQHLIDIPSLHSKSETPVTVIFSNKAGTYEYEARLVRTESVLDEVTKVLYGVVVVTDPYQLRAKTTKRPLRIGSYVQVRIPGRTIDGMYILPEASLRGGDRVFTVDADGVLRARQVGLLSNYDGLNVVSSGFSGGIEKVVVGRVGEAMEGRQVDIATTADTEAVKSESASGE